ncbi:MAG: hypothetical protein AB7W16_07450, partial [Candidatus Obscuribacterales bacterium]
MVDAAEGLQARLAQDEPHNAALYADSYEFHSAHQFATLVKRNFSVLDLNSDGRLDVYEMDEIQSKTEPGGLAGGLSSTLARRMEAVTAMLGGGKRNYFTASDADKLYELSSPELCGYKPSAGKTMGKSIAGGAAGGGIASSLSGDDFSDGAKTGAAVGAFVGLIAAGIEMRNYNKLVESRKTLDSFQEFKNDTCTIYKTGDLSLPELSAKEAAGLAEARSAVLAADLAPNSTSGKLSRQEVRGRLDSLAKSFDTIDSDGDGYLSFPELQSAALSADMKSTASALARNITLVSSLGDHGEPFDGGRISRGDLERAGSQIFAEPTRSDHFFRKVQMGLPYLALGIPGCIIGAIAGA